MERITVLEEELKIAWAKNQLQSLFETQTIPEQAP